MIHSITTFSEKEIRKMIDESVNKKTIFLTESIDKLKVRIIDLERMLEQKPRKFPRWM